MGKTFKDRKDKARGADRQMKTRKGSWVPRTDMPDPNEQHEYQQDYDRERENGEHFRYSV